MTRNILYTSGKSLFKPASTIIRWSTSSPPFLEHNEHPNYSLIKIVMLKIPKYLYYTQIPEIMCKPSFLKNIQWTRWKSFFWNKCSIYVTFFIVSIAFNYLLQFQLWKVLTVVAKLNFTLPTNCFNVFHLKQIARF